MTMYATILCVVCCLLSLTPDLADGARKAKAALFIIDVQDCFVPGGSLAVPGGDEIIPIINQIRTKYKDEFSLVALSKDWHPRGHVSFSSTHPGVPSPIELRYSRHGDLCLNDSTSITIQKFPDAISCDNTSSPIKTVTTDQVLWADHCIENVHSGPTSSNLVKSLHTESDDFIVRKGTHKDIDSYSAFFDNMGFARTGLAGELAKRGITHVFVTGLAGDYCVYRTSVDATFIGMETYYVLDATRFVANETKTAALKDLKANGVHIITSDQLAKSLSEMKAPRSGSSCLLGMSSLLTLWVWVVGVGSLQWMSRSS